MKRIALICAAVVGLSAASAEAITISPTSVTLGAGDVGQLFAVDFGGMVDNQPVAGLTSVAVFEVLAYDAAANYVEFAVALLNTNSSGITSRTSAIGFATAPDATSGSILGTGLFDNVVVNSNFPNFNAIDLCVTGGNSCQGGGGGGVATGEPAGITRFRLNFLDLQAALILDSFAVRYQSITGTTLGNSGYGPGTPRNTVPGDPTPRDVAEPTSMTLLGLGLLGAGLARRRSK